MRIVVCVKHVGVLGDEVEFTDDGTAVDPDYLERALNEWDACAVEAALQLREGAGGGEVVAVTVGDDEAIASLHRALAMGADRAIRIDGDELPEGDPLATARVLADAIGPLGADLVLCGVQTSDEANGATGAALAAYLGLPRAAVARAIEGGDGRLVVERELEGGLGAQTEVPLPALVTVQTGANQPRYATLRAIKQAEQAEIPVVAPEVPAPSARIRKVAHPVRGEGAEMLGDDAAAVAARIVELVRERVG